MTRSRPKQAGRKNQRKTARRKAGPVRNGVSAKASNWLHAKARSVRHSHKPRTIVFGVVSGLFSTIILGLWLSGHLGDAYLASSKFAGNRLIAMGFSVEHIDVSGVRKTSVDEIIQALSVERGELVFAVDLEAARARIEQLGWVEKASVARLLPNRISIAVTERTPYALWQLNGTISIIGSKGQLITSTGDMDLAALPLPLIVGAGANLSSPKLLSDIGARKLFAGKVHSAIRVSDRRWNIQLQTGSVILLPSKNWQSVLDQFEQSPALAALLQQSDLTIDARIAGEFAIRKNATGTIKKVKMLS